MPKNSNLVLFILAILLLVRLFARSLTVAARINPDYTTKPLASGRGSEKILIEGGWTRRPILLVRPNEVLFLSPYPANRSEGRNRSL